MKAPASSLDGRPAAKAPVLNGAGDDPACAAATQLAVLALDLLAVDPNGLAGAVLRSAPGGGREAWLRLLSRRLDRLDQPRPLDQPRHHSLGNGLGGAATGRRLPRLRRVPLHATAEHLNGGLDLALTLSAGRPVMTRGLLGEADGCCLVLASAERTTALVAATLAAALDAGHRRDRRIASFALIALDEGIEPEEHTPAALADRLAFHVDAAALSGLAALENGAADTDPCSGADERDEIEDGDIDALRAARQRLPTVAVPDKIVTGLTTTAATLGIGSLRGPLLALKAARAIAALEGRQQVEPRDAALAAALVLAPRATQLPAADEDAAPEPPGEPDAPEPESADPEVGRAGHEQRLDDMLIDAARAALPDGVLAMLQGRHGPKRSNAAQSRAGPVRRSPRGGKPTGSRPGDPRRGGRLDIVATLRAAAPWQNLRRRERTLIAGKRSACALPGIRLEVRSADLAVRRFKEKSGTLLIFAVDASGSSAMARLAEAKGAVELLLAQCYARRDEVAVIAFRGRTADVLLPPTRALARAKRALADLPGGGGTPLAAAIEAAGNLALSARRRSREPAIVVLTDGRGNVARDGSTGRASGEADARHAARTLSALAIATLVIDTSPRPQADAANLASDLGARYLALPHADARRLSAAVQNGLPRG